MSTYPPQTRSAKTPFPHPTPQTAAGFERDSIVFVITLPEPAAKDDEAEEKEEDRCEGCRSLPHIRFRTAINCDNHPRSTEMNTHQGVEKERRVGFHACAEDGHGFVVLPDVARPCVGHEHVIDVIRERKGEGRRTRWILG